MSPVAISIETILSFCGLPYSIARGVTENAIQYDDLNGARLNPYFRLDGSIIYKISGKANSKKYLALSLQNLTNRKNQLSRRYLISPDQEAEVVPLDLIGLGFTPNLSVNMTF